MKNIPIHLLNAFVLFCESKDIVSAAQKLEITQPALSKQLKNLEQYFQYPLFIMSGRKKTLTAFGSFLQKQLRVKISDIQEIVNQSNLIYSDAKNAMIRISARNEVLSRLVGKIKFEGTIQFIEESNSEIMKMLLANQIEIGIAHTRPESNDVIAKKLFIEKFKLIIPKKILKSYNKKFGKIMEELLAYPFIAYKNQDEILKSIHSHYSIDSSKQKINRIVANYSLIEMIINSKHSKNECWTILPSYIDVKNRNYIEVPINTNHIQCREFYLLYRREFKNTKWFVDLIDNIKAAY